MNYLRPCYHCGGLHSRHHRAHLCSDCLLQSRRERNQLAKLNNMARGRCLDCGKERGPNGTSIRCRPCANVRAAYERKRNREAAEVTA